MSKRIKPVLTVPAVHSLEAADATMAQIAAKKRELSLLELGLKEDVDRLKLACAESAEPIKQEITSLEQALTLFAETQRAELFTKRKSIALAFGTLGFQASTSLKTIKKLTWDAVLGLLTANKLDEYVRTKREVDKEALRTAPAEIQARAGCRLVQEDAFFYKLNETEISTENV